MAGLVGNAPFAVKTTEGHHFRRVLIQQRGGNPFMEDSIPRAVIRFKQGFGRLIRSRDGRGRVGVMDGRVVTARYARLFLAALPKGVPVRRVR